MNCVAISWRGMPAVLRSGLRQHGAGHVEERGVGERARHVLDLPPVMRDSMADSTPANGGARQVFADADTGIHRRFLAL